jgi:hypothetical protein
MADPGGGKRLAQIDAEALHQAAGEVRLLGFQSGGRERSISANGRRHQGYRNHMPGVFHRFGRFTIVQGRSSVKPRSENPGDL